MVLPLLFPLSFPSPSFHFFSIIIKHLVQFLIALVSLIGDFIYSINILPLKMFGAGDVVAGVLEKLTVRESLENGKQTRNAIIVVSDRRKQRAQVSEKFTEWVLESDCLGSSHSYSTIC